MEMQYSVFSCGAVIGRDNFNGALLADYILLCEKHHLERWPFETLNCVAICCQVLQIYVHQLYSKREKKRIKKLQLKQITEQLIAKN